MSIGKILLALTVGGAVYAMCGEKTQKKVKKALKGVGDSIHELREEAAEKAGGKLEEKAHHA